MSLSWESVPLNYRKENGLPRQCEHWLAMTEQEIRAAGHIGPALQKLFTLLSSLQKKKACNAGFFLLLLYSLVSLNTSAMSMSYMCWSMRVTMLL